MPGMTMSRRTRSTLALLDRRRRRSPDDVVWNVVPMWRQDRFYV